MFLILPPHATHCHCFGIQIEISVGDGPGWCDRLGLGGGVGNLYICFLKLSDHLIHRSYLTPIHLSRYRLEHSSACPRCGDPRGTIYHLLGSCPSIQGYRSQVFKFLHNRMGSPLILCLHQCVLGLPSISEEDKYLNIFLQASLLLSGMQIPRTWLRELPPTLQQWSGLLPPPFLIKKKYFTHTGVAQTNITKFGTGG